MVFFVMPFADSHCHLDWFEKPLETIKNAEKEGVNGFFSCATNLGSMKKHLGLFSGEACVKIGLGLHPVDMLRLNEGEIEETLVFLEENASKCHAIGEIGLDYKYAKTQKERDLQETVFARQVGLAVRKKLPVVVHSRRAEKECLEILDFMGAKKVLLHWFTYSLQSIPAAIENGFFMSCGPVIFSSKKDLEAALAIPKELLLLETDCPVAFGGVRSDPVWVKRVAEKLSAQKKEPVEKIGRIAWENYSRLFDKKP
ncbi:MAG: TatD family hydrolase [Candidatus Diapherotrites archaeon]|nr:TatD family hydrolase [Candidatus Diapherotrites archaeon]